MSDIRAQARRDAEFDRLLLDQGLIDDWGHFTEDGMREAYEMGKRHGLEEGGVYTGIREVSKRVATASGTDEVKP